MKIIITILIIIICIYLIFFSLAITKYTDVTFDDIDLNKNKILSPSEINYILNSKIRYKCYYNDKKYVYNEVLLNQKRYQKVILEIFSLKDGLPIKEILLTSDNSKL